MHRYDNIFGSESDTVGKSENYVQILTTPFTRFVTSFDGIVGWLDKFRTRPTKPKVWLGIKLQLCLAIS